MPKDEKQEDKNSVKDKGKGTWKGEPIEIFNNRIKAGPCRLGGRLVW